MLDKLSFSDIVRYLFTGIVVALGIGIAKRVTGAALLDWARNNSEWASGLSPAVFVLLLLVLTGFYSFKIYRTLFCELIVVPAKHWLAKLPRWGRWFYSYRELIQDLMKGQAVSMWEAERIYRVVRNRIAPDVYGESILRAIAALHLFYFTALVLFISCSVAGRWWGSVASFLMFLAALGFDAHSEREELLVFWAKRAELEAELIRLRDNPAWRA